METTLEGQLHALSERYMKNNCACFTSNEGRTNDIVRLAREYHVDGVIDANLKFCTLYDTEKSAVAMALEAHVHSVHEARDRLFAKRCGAA